jgi:ABC-type multidrug transport system ATPase subunit
MLVSLSGMTKRYGELTAADGLSFEVERGEMFGLIGPDGAGKTTTLRIKRAISRSGSRSTAT